MNNSVILKIIIKEIEYNYQTICAQDYLFLSIKSIDDKEEWIHNLGKSNGDIFDKSTIHSQLSNLQKYGLDNTFRQRK